MQWQHEAEINMIQDLIECGSSDESSSYFHSNSSLGGMKCAKKFILAQKLMLQVMLCNAYRPQIFLSFDLNLS